MNINYDEIIQRVGSFGDVLDVLKAIQKEDGYISDEAMKAVANAYNRPVSSIYETVTFYSMLRTNPPKRHVVEICGSTCCDAQKGNALREKLILIDPENTEIKRVECLGHCATAPNAIVDGEFVENATAEKILRILGKAGE